MSDVASKLVAKVIQKTVTDVGSNQSIGKFSGDSSPFKQMLDSMGSGGELAQSLGMTNQGIGLPSHQINAISADGIKVDMDSMNVGLEQPKGIDKVIDLLSEVNDGQIQMENVTNQILYSGKKFSNQELLAIQAHVFHYAQITELVVKTADQGVSSLKAVMNTNIQ
jgi:hypothetical protein